MEELIASLYPSTQDEQSPHIYIYIMDTIRLRTGNVSISEDTVRSLKLWSVLCYFLIHRDRAIPSSELIDVFWQDEEQKEPHATLRVMILRIRRLLEPLFDHPINPILNLRSAYQWNPEINCYVDAEIFDALCSLAASPNISDEEKLDLYRKALPLYRGEFLAKQSDQHWIIPLASRYRSIYSAAVKKFISLLQATGQHDAMCSTALAACQLLPFDEQLHIQVIRSFMLQNKYAEALQHYQKTTKLLYQSLGVRPTENLQAVYMEILQHEKGYEVDLDIILSSLDGPAPGAFFCEFGVFSSIYQLEARRIARSGGCLHVALVSLSMDAHTGSRSSSPASVMDLLQSEICISLRQGDVVSRYSKSQFIIMLPFASLEDSTMVIDRIISSFNKRFSKPFFNISYVLKGLEPSSGQSLPKKF